MGNCNARWDLISNEASLERRQHVCVRAHARDGVAWSEGQADKGHVAGAHLSVQYDLIRDAPEGDPQ